MDNQVEHKINSVTIQQIYNKIKLECEVENIYTHELDLFYITSKKSVLSEKLELISNKDRDNIWFWQADICEIQFSRFSDEMIGIYYEHPLDVKAIQYYIGVEDFEFIREVIG